MATNEQQSIWADHRLTFACICAQRDDYEDRGLHVVGRGPEVRILGLPHGEGGISWDITPGGGIDDELRPGTRQGRGAYNVEHVGWVRG
ncbi:MAG: hypothetical protein JWM36_2260 [Hyphomicrobiales bacterium]|nr:hypothetical protein [Hyphomicrobiales bacterium]